MTLGGAASASAQDRSQTERAGDALMVALPAVALGVTALLEDWNGSGAFAGGFAANVLTTEALKRIVHRARPDGSDHRSFPSGHTSIAFQAASFVHFRYGLDYAIPAYAGAVFVAYSRVSAKKHFVGDVVAGAVLGTLTSRLITDRRPQSEFGQPAGLAFGVHMGFGGAGPPTFGVGWMPPRP